MIFFLVATSIPPDQMKSMIERMESMWTEVKNIMLFHTNVLFYFLSNISDIGFYKNSEQLWVKNR